MSARSWRSYGDKDKRVAILEFGWTTDDRPDSPYYWHGAGAGIDEATKGKYLVRAFEWAEENWQPWIGLMTVIYMPDVNWTKDDEQYYWSIIGPGYPDLFLRAAYVELCIYLNKARGPALQGRSESVTQVEIRLNRSGDLDDIERLPDGSLFVEIMPIYCISSSCVLSFRRQSTQRQPLPS